MKKAIVLVFLTALGIGVYGGDLIEAVKGNDIATVKKLVGEDPQRVRIKDSDGRTPLHWAARGVHFEILSYLVEQGADTNAADVNQVTPLISAVVRDHYDAAKLLLAHGAKVDSRSNSGETALHCAAQRGCVEIVKLLIEGGADLEAKNGYQRTPLVLGTRERGGLKTVRVLVEAGADINSRDYSGDSALSLAAWRGYGDIVDYLLVKGADLGSSKEKISELETFAVGKRLWNLHERIKRQEKDLNALSNEKISLLHRAAKGGSKRIVADLIEYGFDVNELDVFGFTPLHYAAESGRLSTVKILLGKGAKVDVRSRVMETPYILACKAGHRETADYLVSKGAGRTMAVSTGIQGMYFGQEKPGCIPRLFVPGIATDLTGGHSNVVFSPDGETAVWTRWIESETGYALGSNLMYSRKEAEGWTVPEILMENGDTPFFSVDGKRLYFMKKVRDPSGKLIVNEIQYCTNKDGGWAEPEALPFDVASSGLYWQFSFDREGNIYFSNSDGLYRSLVKGGKYQSIEKLTDVLHPDYIGGGPFISPDADYLIFSSMKLPGRIGQVDLYIGFRKADGTWTKPINMGNSVNTEYGDHLPVVSPDGKYLFLMTRRDGVRGRHWVSAEIIEELKAGGMER